MPDLPALDPAAAARRLTGLDARPSGPGGRLELADGRPVFVKRCDLPGAIAAEVAGLRWLAEPGTLPVPEVLGHDDRWLVVDHLPPSPPSPGAARAFGAALARTHAAGATAFGTPPPGGPVEAWIGRAPMRNVEGTDWPQWYVEHRVRPYLRAARDRGTLDGAETALVERACATAPSVAGPPVAPARLHGDLWSGNVLVSGGRAWVIDPAAHGGHPETDLAMLALFGFPYLAEARAGYQEARPLPDGWSARVGLHQLFPLLVHVVLFGRGYAGQALAAAGSVLRIP